MKRKILSIITVLALCLSLCPTWALAAESFSPIPELYVLGNEVVNGDVKSGDGWSFENNTLTLENLHIEESDYPESAAAFLNRGTITGRGSGVTIYLKGNNTICGTGALRTLFKASNCLLSITGDPGATLELNGYVQMNAEISGDITVINNTTTAFYVDYGISLDKGAKLIINSDTPPESEINYTMWLTPAGEVSIKNGSSLEVNTLNTGTDTERYYSMFGYGPLLVEDSTLTINNRHPNGQAAYIINPWGAIRAEDTATIKNSDVTLNASRGIFSYNTTVSNSTVATSERTSIALLSQFGETKVTNSTVNGLVVSNLSDSTQPTEYVAYGEAHLPANLTVAAGNKLTVPTGASLDVHEGVTLTNNGSMHIHDAASLPGAGTLAGEGTFTADVSQDLIDIPDPLYYTGEDLKGQIKLKNTLTAMGREFTVDTTDWVMTAPSSVINAGSYEVMFEKDFGGGGRGWITKSFEVLQSGTQLTGDGTAKAYKGNEETYAFSAGETITVKAKPAPTGDAPMAVLMAEPEDGQMAVYYKGEQLSNPADPDENGVYTMEVDTNNLPVGAFNVEIPLTVKYAGSPDMAEAEAEVKVTVTAEAQVKTDDGATACYGTFAEAWDAALKAGTATITMLADVTITGGNLEMNTAGTEITLVGNGKTLQFDSSYDLKAYNGKLTFQGCTITKPGSSIMTINGSGQVELQHSIIKSNAAQAVRLYAENGLTMDEDSRIINGLDCIKPQQLTAGRFEGSKDVYITTTNCKLGNLLKNYGVNTIDEHYAFFDGNGDPIYDMLGEKMFPARKYTVVTIGPCETHVFTYTHDEEALTHTKTCRACGYSVAAENCRYDFADGTVGTCPGCKDTVSVNVAGIGAVTYDGAAQTAVVDVTNKNGKAIGSSNYTVEYENNINAGTASFTVTIGDNQGTYEGMFTIHKATPTIAWESNELTQTLTYTGEPAAITEPVVTLVNNETFGGEIIYSYTGTSSGKGLPTDAGTYTVTARIAESGNYTAAESLNTLALTINKAAASVTKAPAAPERLTYTGAPQALVTPGEASVGKVVYALSRDGEYSETVPTGVNAGNYTVWYKIAETANYTGTEPLKVDVSIHQALYPGQTNALASAKSGATASIDLAALLPEGFEAGVPGIVNGDIFDGVPTLSGTILSYKLKENAAAGDSGMIQIPVASANYAGFPLVVSVIVTDRDVPLLTVNPITAAYSGSPVTNELISGTATVNGVPVPGQWSFVPGQALTDVADSGAKSVVFTPDNTENYGEAQGVAALTINPVSLSGAAVKLSAAAFRDDGTAHAPTVDSVNLEDITLAAGVDYTADIPSGTEPGKYTVTITGKGNYTGTATAAYTVNEVEASEFKDESGRDLRLEVETGLSTVPDALSKDTRFDTPEKIETALRTQVTEVMSNVGENIAVLDVTLQYRDDSGVWHDVDLDDFPPEGVTAILPYPAGTGATGWTFTVQHLISSGSKAGEMENLAYKLTGDGLECVFESLSPVAIGYKALTKPTGSGSGGVSTYPVTVEKAEHGKVVSNTASAGSGSTVTLTVTPDSGYVLDALTVTDSRSSEIKLTGKGGGKYSFTMPAGAVTVKASFVTATVSTQPCDGGAGCPSRAFADVDTGAWYHEAVDYAVRNGLMSGYSSGAFGPNDALTRAQLAQILFNKEGGPVVNYLLQFDDVSEGAWYCEAVRWAASQGIVSGYGNGRFGPNDNITREQLAVMLWRYAGSPAATERELNFADADKAGAWALEALRWAVENGIVSGKGNGILDPTGSATRAEAAQMLKNFLER